MAGAPQEQAARQLFAELYAAADLSERQIHQIGMIVDARLTAQGAQTQTQIAAVQSRIEEASQLVGSMRVTIDGNQSDVNKTKDEIRSFMTDIDTKRDDLENRLKTAFSGTISTSQPCRRRLPSSRGTRTRSSPRSLPRPTTLRPSVRGYACSSTVRRAC